MVEEGYVAQEVALLQVNNVSLDFGRVRALNKVTITFEKGLAHAVIGANGAGKTTLLNVISGVFRPQEGHVVFNGIDITKKSIMVRRRLGISRSFQATNIFPHLSIKENINLGLQALGNRPYWPLPHGHSDRMVQDKITELLEIVGLRNSLNEKVASLSYGDQRRVDIALALTSMPKLILLDEPTAGLPPKDSEELAIVMKAAARKVGSTIIIVEHDMNVVFGIADRLVVLDHGRILAQGLPDEVRNVDEVKRAYLGGDVAS